MSSAQGRRGAKRWRNSANRAAAGESVVREFLKSARAVLICLVLAAAATAQDSARPLSAADAKKLKNPIPYSRKSISQGKSTFARYCAGCHGSDGKAMVDVVADATDLTQPKAWKNGTSEGEIFRSIRDGQSASMPAFQSQIKKEEDMWHLVNFIQSLWPESMRPALQDSEPPAGKTK